MTSREDFSDEEWFRVRAAPWQAAMGLIEAAPTGTFATGRELRAVEEELRRAGEEADGLVRLVAVALADENDEDTGTPPDEAGVEELEALPDRVLAAMRDLTDLLDAKVDAAESEAYRRWLAGLAAIAASAAKERVAGLAGRKVSEAEQAYLDRLHEALAV
ncbi:MAG TPA: hypothetical protein VID94_17485 [Acidimicrobiales bacterium]